LSPSFVAGIINSVKEINFYVLCNENLKYVDYIEKCISCKKCTICFTSCTGNYFQFSGSRETIVITFDTLIIHGKLLSELTFAYALLNEIHLSSLAYGIMSAHKHVNYVINEVLTSKHSCVFECYTRDLDTPKRLSNCKLYTKYCSAHPYKKSPFYIV
jgi:hypothetical protein